MREQGVWPTTEQLLYPRYMRTLMLALTVFLAPSLLAQAPRRDAGALATATRAVTPTSNAFRPLAPTAPPRGSNARAAIIYGSMLAGGVALVIITKPDKDGSQPLVPALRVPLALVTGAFIGLITSTQILRLFDD